jgi:hypothetical protein
VKTAQKLEKPCFECEQEALDKLRLWKESRFTRLEPVDPVHLGLFKRAMAVNVPYGWNETAKYVPYIPTGHATRSFTRKEGGSWNEEDFETTCGLKSVLSSGKPRIVTLYSGANSEILRPLHVALYERLKEKGWLLVGSPTDEKVQALGASGVYVSVDYTSATDNIRAEYCRAAIAVLKEKAVGLTPRQSEALDVLGHLRFCDGGEVATRGQPMGSLMSFPLLCLINKTVVDLAVLDRALSGEVSWKEFRAHRCLINGDDLLYREFGNSPDILAGILHHGSRVGFEVNSEKTMVSPDWAEVNSTAFFQGRKQKKTNVAVLKWSSEVTDPVGFLADSVVHRAVFRELLLFWSTPIRNARRKIQGPLPTSFWSALWQVKDALCWLPTAPPAPPNPFPVVPKPAGYDLTREEEVCYISERVARLKERGYKPAKSGRCSTRSGEVQTIQRALRKEKPCVEDNILKVLADAWEWKTKEKLRLEDEAANGPLDYSPEWCTACYEGSHSLVQCITDKIKAFRQREVQAGCASQDAGRLSGQPGGGVPHRVEWPDYVPLE